MPMPIIPAALRRAGRVLPSPPAWPCGTALRPLPTEPFRQSRGERCEHTHRDMDIDPRVCRRGGSSLGGRLFTTDCEKVFFYITVASNAQQLRPRANPARSRSRHFPPGMMRGAGRPSTCLLFQPYTAQRNPERPLLPSHADER